MGDNLRNRTVSIDKSNINKNRRESQTQYYPKEDDLNLDHATELFNNLISQNMIDWDNSTQMTKAESINNLAN